MKKELCQKLNQLLAERQEDFREDFEFKLAAWRQYLKRLGVRKANEEGICELYNRREPGILIEDSRTGIGWFLIPEELAEKSLALGGFPPRKTRKKTRPDS